MTEGRRSRCYLCGGTRLRVRPGKVRDSAKLKPLECAGCGLVFLSSFAHIREGFYEDSGMLFEGWDLKRWREESARDDERRFGRLRPVLEGKRVLDFGSGNAGFLLRAKKLAKEASGIELERKYYPVFKREGLRVHPEVDDAPGAYDVITAFHVIEHLPDPKAMLRRLAGKLSRGGRLYVEVPSADDALLTFYECKAFREFTYWSCHLYLFTPATLRALGEQAGLKVRSVEQVQRFPLSNHLHWLAKGKPGGHKVWSALDEGGAAERYERRLAELGRCDTLLAVFSMN